MKLIDILTGKKPGIPKTPGECFPDTGKKVPYTNPHPDGETGSFPDAPKPPKKPSVFRERGC